MTAVTITADYGGTKSLTLPFIFLEGRDESLRKLEKIIIPQSTSKISFLIYLHKITHIVNGEIKLRYKEDYLVKNEL